MSAFLSIHRLAMSSQRLRSQSLSSDGSEASFDGDGSGRSASGSPQPRTPPLDARGASPPFLVPVESAISSTSRTSFFIRDILRPDFGIKREQKTELFPTHPAFVKQEGALDSLSSQRFREDLPSPRARQVDPAGRASPEHLWPAWVFCTRYSDRPSAGPRSRKIRKMKTGTEAEKRPRTAFSTEQLQRLRQEFESNRYLTEQRRRQLAEELSLSDSQIKIWFQNKRAKLKKSTGKRNGLALQLMAQGLYNHSTMAMDSQE